MLIYEYFPQGEEEDVRAPIPQKQEVLVEGLDELAYTFRGKRRVARSVFDKFRDFEAETSKCMLITFTGLAFTENIQIVW